MHVPWIEFVASLFIAAICMPLLLRKVPRNGFYGMRTARTMSGSDENWLEVNHQVGLGMMVAALISAAGDLILGLIPISATGRYATAALLLLAAAISPVLIYRKRLF